MSEKILVEALVNRPRRAVWECFNQPEHIVGWNFANDDWHCPFAENDLRVGGRLRSRMEAKDGSFGFDFEGLYDEVVEDERVAYAMPDGRQVETDFADEGEATRVSARFDAENENPAELQRAGWQAILDNFKRYAESV